jgi:hypothetical protein
MPLNANFERSAKRMLKWSCVALLLVTTAGAATTAQTLSVPGTVAKGTNELVIAYYFHGTVRCETCLKIEKQARETIERKFPMEIGAKRLAVRPVNYEKPENAHFVKDYGLACPSLVLVRQRGGKDEKWKLLDKTWDYIENPVKFDDYVEKEVEKLVAN